MLKELNEQDYNSVVENAEEPIILKFTADW
ncbi:hypothetical protein SAMN05192534_101364 [Alteribacillus persepolensis]|uniref:Thioredoxin n=1 Tax=Alteribacillus persepolensis TaxID=568899 RepID=A0A1G7Z1L6_9BACI|nr:hypothetical protein SAMN05192534_101364 [Alteribacillus persepolensis]